MFFMLFSLVLLVLLFHALFVNDKENRYGSKNKSIICLIDLLQRTKKINNNGFLLIIFHIFTNIEGKVRFFSLFFCHLNNVDFNNVPHVFTHQQTSNNLLNLMFNLFSNFFSAIFSLFFNSNKHFLYNRSINIKTCFVL